MKKITSNDIVTNKLSKGAIIHDYFAMDYLVIHCLIKKHKPKTFIEIGTNMGVGTNIICNANPKMKVYSLDLPYELSHVSKQSPVSEGKGENTGSKCTFPFTQLWGDSTKYDYSQHYPLDAWYIDGEHTFDNVFKESFEAFKSKAKIIIWHDTDMEGVYNGIIESCENFIGDYDLYRVEDTRISYALWRDTQ